MSNENQTAYRGIMKATSLFGGVQVVNIIISVIRSKIIAIILGPAGIGIFGLLTSSLSLISGITNLGLGTSSVKDISEAYATGNLTRISIIEGALTKWMWFTGLAGLTLTVLFSPLLSYLSFGNYHYTLSFVILSLTLLFTQITNGQMAILQGSSSLKLLAKANVYGSLLSLFTTIPLYFFWKENGIVPAIILSTLSTFFIAYHFRLKVAIKKIQVSKLRSFAEGKKMVKLGFIVSISGFLTLVGSYLVRIYISQTNGISDVGLYNAGFNILNVYVGMIFTAMVADYYPRISAANTRNQINLIVNQQAEIAILLLGPIIILFIGFIDLIIGILYSNEFNKINEMMVWAALGILFKAPSWAMGFILLTKGKPKEFLFSEIFATILITITSILSYKMIGLTGLGLSYLACYLIYFIFMNRVVSKKFRFRFSNKFFYVFSLNVFLCLLTLFNYLNIKGFYYFVFLALIFLISTLISFKTITKYLGPTKSKV